MTEKNHLRLIVGANLLLIALACANICAHFSQPGFLLLSASVANAADFAFNALLVPFMAIVIYFLVVNDLRVRRGEAKICAAEMDTLTMNALLLFVPFWLSWLSLRPPLLALLQLAGDVVVIYRCLRTFLPPRPIPPARPAPAEPRISAKVNYQLLAGGYALLLAAILTCIPAQLAYSGLTTTNALTRAIDGVHYLLLVPLILLILWLFFARSRLPLASSDHPAALAIICAVMLLLFSPLTTTAKAGYTYFYLLMNLLLLGAPLLGLLRLHKGQTAAA